MNKTFFEFNNQLDDLYSFVLDPSANFEEANLAVKETFVNHTGNLCQTTEWTKTILKTAAAEIANFSNVRFVSFTRERAENGTFPAFSSISRIDSRYHWKNEIEFGGKTKMILAGFERKLQISGILVLLGIIIELAPLFNQINATSFVMTLLFGAILMCLGLFLFVYSLVA